MNNLIVAVRESLVAKNYISALTIALILPDICGKFLYPEITGRGSVGKRYEKWYDEYIYKYENPKEYSEEDKTDLLDGHIIYKLRCKLMHEGSLDIDENLRRKYNLNENQYLHFIITNSEVDSYLKLSHNDETSEANLEIRLSVVNLCEKICAVAENIYKENKVNLEINNDIIEFDF